MLKKSVGSLKLQIGYRVIMKFKVILVSVFILVVHFCSAQLVRRVDYDAAIAVQAGGSTGILLPGKMPFTSNCRRKVIIGQRRWTV